MSGQGKEVNVNTRSCFRWKVEAMENLIDSLQQYQSFMSYKNLDFNVDKPIQYNYLSVKLTKCKKVVRSCNQLWRRL